jgi:hypothetical protein
MLMLLKMLILLNFDFDNMIRAHFLMALDEVYHLWDLSVLLIQIFRQIFWKKRLICDQAQKSPPESGHKLNTTYDKGKDASICIMRL